MFENVPIQISEISLIPIKPKNGLLGFASFVLNNQFYLGEIAIRSCPSGEIRLLYPSKKLFNGEDIPLFHPITKDAGQTVLNAINSEWEDLMRLKGSA